MKPKQAQNCPLTPSHRPSAHPTPFPGRRAQTLLELPALPGTDREAGKRLTMSFLSTRVPTIFKRIDPGDGHRQDSPPLPESFSHGNPRCTAHRPRRPALEDTGTTVTLPRGSQSPHWPAAASVCSSHFNPSRQTLLCHGPL